MRIEVTVPFTFNISGYDRPASRFDAGELDVPDAVAEYALSQGYARRVAAASSAAQPGDEARVPAPGPKRRR